MQLENISPVLLAFLAGMFTWGVTAIGAAGVFFSRTADKKTLDTMLGFAAGVMIAASFWSLLAPAISVSKEMGYISWLAPALGFLAGAGFLRLIDMVLPHLHLGLKRSEAEGIRTNWKKSTLLFLAITMHNIPEGLAIGVAFGAIASGIGDATLAGAMALAIGIGLQNFPEGMALSLPLHHEGKTKLQAFWMGQLSAVVEPIAALIGAAAVLLIKPILPFALSFAAGAMIFVVIEELIPESQRAENSDIATMATVLGFVVMMVLDVALG